MPKGYVEVVATARGFYGVGKLGSRIEEGETFYVREGARCGSWFQVVDEKDSHKLLPSKKADKLKAKREADRLFRMAKDPVALIQTVREMAMAGAPIGIPEGKTLVAAPTKPAPKPQ